MSFVRRVSSSAKMSMAVLEVLLQLLHQLLAAIFLGSYALPSSLHKKIHQKLVFPCILKAMLLSQFMPVSCSGLKSQRRGELVRQTRRDRWEVTRVSRGRDARLQTHWTSALLPGEAL